MQIYLINQNKTKKQKFNKKKSHKKPQIKYFFALLKNVSLPSLKKNANVQKRNKQSTRRSSNRSSLMIVTIATAFQKQCVLYRVCFYSKYCESEIIGIVVAFHKKKNTKKHTRLPHYNGKNLKIHHESSFM